MKGDRDLKAHV